MRQKITRAMVVVSISTIWFSVSALAGRVVQLNDRLQIDCLEQDVFLVTHSYPWPANSMIVKSSDTDFVWIDTPYTDDATLEVLGWLEQRFGTVNLIEINTGFHVDNLGGNTALIEKNVPVFGTPLTCRLLRERSDNTQRQILAWINRTALPDIYSHYEQMAFSAPGRLISPEPAQNMEWGNETFEIFYPGPSHSPDNLLVYFPKRQLLFGGCMVKERTATKLGFTKDADPEQWAAALEKALNRYPDVRTVIPGHGRPGNIDLISHTIRLIGK